MVLGVMVSSFYRHTQTQHIEGDRRIEGDSKKEGDNWFIKQIVATIIAMLLFFRSRER
jgi:hypothetical protein